MRKFLVFLLFLVWYPSAFADESDFSSTEAPTRFNSVYSYIQNKEYLHALSELDNLPDDENTNVLKARIYYDLQMYDDAKKCLKKVKLQEKEDIENKIKVESAFSINTEYSFLVQQLSETYDLNYKKYCLSMNEYGAKNTNVALLYNINFYSSNKEDHRSTLVNEIQVKVQSRPIPELEYKIKFGAKFFQWGVGDMLVTDDWILYHLNDKLALKLGFSRTNLEQSYVSAVGDYIDNNFVGRVAENQVYIESLYSIPEKYYISANYAFKVLTGQNLQTNFASVFTAIIGKELYKNENNKFIKNVVAEFINTSYAYQYNLKNLAERNGEVYGGYFSPSFYNVSTINVNLQGSNKRLHLKYGLQGFVGEQYSLDSSECSFTWGFAPYLTYIFNEHVSVSVNYKAYNYADIIKHFFSVNAEFKLFRKTKKS